MGASACEREPRAEAVGSEAGSPSAIPEAGHQEVARPNGAPIEQADPRLPQPRLKLKEVRRGISRPRGRELSRTQAGRLGTKESRRDASLFEQHILPGVGSFPLRDIKPTDITRWINKVGQRFSYSVAHKCLTQVPAIFDRLVVFAKNLAGSTKNAVGMPKTRKIRATTSHWGPCSLRPASQRSLCASLAKRAPGKLRIEEAVVMGSAGGNED